MKKALNKAILFKVLAFLLLIAPLLTLFIVKKDKYFITTEETVKLSVGAVIALIFVVWQLLSKAKEDKEMRYFTGILKLGILEIIMYLMKSIVNDVLIIIPCAMSGMILFWIVDRFLFTPNWETYQICKKASIDERARMIVRQNIQEIQEDATGGNV